MRTAGVHRHAPFKHRHGGAAVLAVDIKLSSDGTHDCVAAPNDERARLIFGDVKECLPLDQLDIPLDACEPLEGALFSQAARAIVGDAMPFAFRVANVNFRFYAERHDRLWRDSTPWLAAGACNRWDTIWWPSFVCGGLVRIFCRLRSGAGRVPFAGAGLRGDSG